MIKKLIAALLICYSSLLYAQTIKTDVLVIGGSPAGTAAAIQSARSKVKTILAAQNITIESGNPANEMCTLDANIQSGIGAEFSKQVKDFYKNTKGYDTAYNAPVRFEPGTGTSILKKITDTVKNLTLYPDASFTAIKKDGDRWEVNILQHGKTITIKARVVVDATENGDVAVKAGAKFKAEADDKKNTGSNLYRTSIAGAEILPNQKYADSSARNDQGWYIPVNAVLLKDANNLLVTAKAIPGEKNIQYLPLQLETGQGIGAVAAYCAFFKTNTQNLKVRLIQSELLDFKEYLLPFADISQKDRNWRAIQQVCATGLLKGSRQITGNHIQLVFMPDSLVATAGIKPVLTEIYTRAFIWFKKEKTGEKFTLGNMLSFISDYTLTDPEILNKSVQRDWKTLYKFKLDFDLKRPVTRREFAVLTNKFLNPFARTIDLSGRFIN